MEMVDKTSKQVLKSAEGGSLQPQIWRGQTKVMEFPQAMRIHGPDRKAKCGLRRTARK